MPVRYLIVGILGMALALFGIMRTLYPAVAAGIVLILAAFFLFSRTNQGTPAPANGDDSAR